MLQQTPFIVSVSLSHANIWACVTCAWKQFSNISLSVASNHFVELQEYLDGTGQYAALGPWVNGIITAAKETVCSIRDMFEIKVIVVIVQSILPRSSIPGSPFFPQQGQHCYQLHPPPQLMPTHLNSSSKSLHITTTWKMQHVYSLDRCHI